MDETFALMRDPYRFISKKCRDNNTDLFQTRIMFQKTMCMTGEEAAREVFYNTDCTMRKGAAPGMLKATLLGKGGVQDLDGEAHRHRKAMFMSIMTPENVEVLGNIVSANWLELLPSWKDEKEIVLYDKLHEILTEAACSWAGVPLPKEDIKQRSKELTALFDSAGAKGIRHLWSRFSRKKLDRWMMGIVRDIRQNSTQIITPAQIIAHHKDLDGKLLSEHTAAVELLNIVRPIIAVSVYMIFVAHALEKHPESRLRLDHREEGYADLFILEVRRLYPFFPAMMGKAKKDFEWRGKKFQKGMRIMMDVYGTNHDPRQWTQPTEFKPERFRKAPGLFNYVPQGGGDPNFTHRCPGEPITLELMKVMLDFLVFRMDYKVPKQDLTIDWGRLPGIPHSRFVINNVEPGHRAMMRDLNTRQFSEVPLDLH